MRARILVGGLIALTLGFTAACGGSALDPGEVLRANEAVLGQTSDDGTGPVTGGNDPVTGGNDPVTGGNDPVTGGNDPVTGGNDPVTGGNGNTNGNNGNAPPAGGGIKAASCDGFKNQRGVTNDKILIGNSSDLSGPVPGLFTAAQVGAKAYVAYFNATNPNGICGRKLELITDDSRTDNGGDQQAYLKFCDRVFAGVGSLSAFDGGGADTTEKCNLPDIRATATTAERNSCATCFGAQATGAYEYSNGIPDFFVKNYKAASQKAAFLFLNAGASAENAKTQIAVEQKRGMKFLYTSPIDVAEFNYGPYVQQMKSKGVQYVQFIGGYQQAVRLAQAMQSAAFKPQVAHFDQTTDDANYLKSGGNSIEGFITSLTYKPLFESQPELNTYKQWLRVVSPGSTPSGFGLFGWSAGKLFVEQALALGGKLNPNTLVARLRGVHDWTAGGMHGPMDVGSRHTADCVRFQQVKNGKFVAMATSRSFLCTGITKVSG